MVAKMEKIADLFEKKTNQMFDEISLREEAKHLTAIAGRLFYRSKKENNPEVAMRLKEVARVTLLAADELKKL